MRFSIARTTTGGHEAVWQGSTHRWWHRGISRGTFRPNTYKTRRGAEKKIAKMIETNHRDSFYVIEVD